MTQQCYEDGGAAADGLTDGKDEVTPSAMATLHSADVG
jgi:hypothetical protein